MDGARPGRKNGVTGEMQAPVDAENSTDTAGCGLRRSPGGPRVQMCGITTATRPLRAFLSGIDFE